MADCAYEQTSPRVDLRGLLSELVNHVEMLAHAVVASEDGHPLAASAEVSVSDAAMLAAVSAAVTSTALAAAVQFEAGAVHTVTVRMQRGQLTLLSTSGGSLALQTQSRCDVTWLINQTKPVLAALNLPRSYGF